MFSFILFVCVCTCVFVRAHHSMCVEVREQFVVLSFYCMVGPRGHT